jgi:hypothetical protein
MCKEIKGCLPPILLFVESVFEAAVKGFLEIKAAVEVKTAILLIAPESLLCQFRRVHKRKQKPGFEAVVEIEAAVKGILEIMAVIKVETVMCRRRYQGRGRTQERVLVRKSASA